MKVWSKIKLKDNDKYVNLVSNSLTNYLYNNSPIKDIKQKYKISTKEIKELEEYMASRIAGLLLLYSTKDTSRINDIVNKYGNNSITKTIIPELEVYLDK